MGQSSSKQSRRSKHSYGERKITQQDELKSLVWGLELDEGIRFLANVPDHPAKSFIFITKCDEKICVTIKERIFDKLLNEYVPGGREEWKYFETSELAWEYITKLLKPPIEAYYY
jgi:hypothetical protein